MKKKQIILWMIVVSFLGLAVFLSAQSTEESVNLTDRILRIIGKYLVTNTNDMDIFVQYNSNIFRKILHFSLFALATIPLYLLVYSYVKNVEKTAILTLCIVALYAANDEWRQITFSDRHFLKTDILIDTLGGFFSILLLSTIVKFRSAIHNSSKSD